MRCAQVSMVDSKVKIVFAVARHIHHARKVNVKARIFDGEKSVEGVLGESAAHCYIIVIITHKTHRIHSAIYTAIHTPRIMEFNIHLGLRGEQTKSLPVAAYDAEVKPVGLDVTRKIVTAVHLAAREVADNVAI